MTEACQKIKVLTIIPNLKVAGAQTVVMNYLRSFHADTTFDFRVLVINKKEDSDYDIEAERYHYPVDYIGLNGFKKIPVVRAVLNWCVGQISIMSYLMKYKPDVVHTHQTKILKNVVIPVLLCRIKKRFHTLHSDPRAVPKRFRGWASFAFRTCKFVPVCVTTEQAKIAKEIYKIDNPVVIRNGIDLDKYRLTESKNEIRKSIDIIDESYVIGYVGRLDAVKNIGFLIDLFAALVREKPNSLLLIIGEGPEKSKLVQKCRQHNITDKVKFMGIRMDVERIYKAMDMFAITSISESNSIVTVEAQISGIQCAISDAIPKDAIVSDEVIRLSLTEPTGTWVKALMGIGEHSTPVSSIDDYSLEGCLEKVKALYFGLPYERHTDTSVS